MEKTFSDFNASSFDGNKTANEVVVSPAGVRGIPKKMPFYHFSTDVQDKLKSKTMNSPK